MARGKKCSGSGMASSMKGSSKMGSIAMAMKKGVKPMMDMPKPKVGAGGKRGPRKGGKMK